MSTSPDHPSLWVLSAGDSAIIQGVCGREIDAASQRLMDLGFRAGQRVTCLLIPGFGAPRVYVVGGATYSLDRATATRITLLEPTE